MALPARDRAAIPRHLFPRQQSEKAVEQRFRAGDQAVEEVRRQRQQVFARRDACCFDQGGEVGPEAEAIAAGVIVGEARADEVAVDKRAPSLAVEKGEGEAALQIVHGHLVVFEILAAHFLSDSFEIERCRVVRGPGVAADQQRERVPDEEPSAPAANGQ